ncbi:MAG: FtsQ-type POTRA domain-containing protein, partial [Magnetococcus sp. WYHC-3]
MLLRLLILAILVAASGIGWNEWRQNRHEGSFPLEEVRFQGLTRTDPERALRVLGIPKGTNLLHINLKAVRKRLLSLPWVQDVEIERILPSGRLLITLREKTAVCLSRQGERLYLIDKYGRPIQPFERNDPLYLPVVVPSGDGDPAEDIVQLLNLLAERPWLKERISEAVGFAGGRWTLYTKNGVRILISRRAHDELALLGTLQDRFQILDREVLRIDLRVTGKAAVLPRPMPVEPVSTAAPGVGPGVPARSAKPAPAKPAPAKPAPAKPAPAKPAPA